MSGSSATNCFTNGSIPAPTAASAASGAAFVPNLPKVPKNPTAAFLTYKSGTLLTSKFFNLFKVGLGSLFKASAI